MQISCGRKHTLAFVPNGGRVYAWGLGGAGQLGTRSVQSVTSPQVVLGPWLSSKDIFAIKLQPSLSSYTEDCVVKHIFSGGYHCFATVSHKSVFILSFRC